MSRILALAFALTLSACGTSSHLVIIGKDFPHDKISQIKRNETNRLEVVKLLGKPFTRTLTDSTEIFSYRFARTLDSFVYQNSASTTVSDFSKELTVTFDTTGIARSVFFSISGEQASTLQLK